MQSEAYFYHIWEKFPLGTNILNADEELIILSRGDLSTNLGPDFQGARISFNGEVYSGDIEIHLRSSDWYHHGHHLNRAFNNVILHLVWNSENREIITNNNLSIPELSFQNLQIVEEPGEDAKPDLIELFFQRYVRKLTYCQELLQFYSPEDVLWILLSRTLGYRLNADTMELFARVYYPVRIRQLIHSKAMVEEILISAAFRDENKNSQSLLHHLPRLQVPWRNGGRPANNPERRIKYLSLLIQKFWITDIFKVTNDIIVERKKWDFILKQISDLFRVTDKKVNPGRGRLIVFIINWILPLMNAVHPDQPIFQQYLLDLYWSIPPETISRKLPDHIGNPVNAAESQGLFEWRERQKGDFKPWVGELRIPYGI